MNCENMEFEGNKKKNKKGGETCARYAANPETNDISWIQVWLDVLCPINVVDICVMLLAATL